MIDELFLVLSDAPVELVDKAVNCSVHIFFYGVSVNLAAVYVDCSLCFVPQLFDREYAVYSGDEVKMAADFFDFGFNITTKCFSYFDVVP